jgi:hypothetical protein
MFTPTGNAEEQFTQRRDQFKADLKSEIDAIMTREGTSPLRLVLAVDNVTGLIAEIQVIERASVTMSEEMPHCFTVHTRTGYYGPEGALLAKTHMLQFQLTVLRNNLLRMHTDRHWIVRQTEAVNHYSDL